MKIKLNKQQIELLDDVLDDYIENAGKQSNDYGHTTFLEFDSYKELDALDDIRTILNEERE